MERFTTKKFNPITYKTETCIKLGANYEKAVEKLTEYEDLEEQGKLLKLPCMVGNTVYRINKGARNPVIQMEIHEISIFYLKSKKLVIQMKCRDDMDMGERFYLLEEIGKNLFLTKKEAKEALKRDGENSQSKIMAEDVSGLANVFGVNFTREDTAKLKNWIDEEEQGKLQEVPYKPGEEIWCVFVGEEPVCQVAYFMAICEDRIIACDYRGDCRGGFRERLEEMEADYINGFDSGFIIIHKDYVFPTKEQAKEVLRKIK